MELKTTADRRDYLYVQAWVDEPASGMDVINLLSDLTAALARVEELEKQVAASQRQVAKMAREMVSCGCPGCPLELTCECQGGAGVDCVAKVEEWASNHICGKTAKYERDGKHYCGIHDPVSIVERQRKRNEKNKPQREREAFEGRKRWYAGDMLEILERLHTNDGVPVDEVDELIKKVRGGYE